MKCPHCLENFHDKPTFIGIGDDKDGSWGFETSTCPACNRFVIFLQTGPHPLHTGGHLVGFYRGTRNVLVRPKGATRPPCPDEVPEKLRTDYLEACLVLADSAKASAALGRRCLQNLLRETAQVKPGNLAAEIQQVMDSGKLPSDLHESIDAIRNIGNFAAHPLKSQNSGEILDVEPGEAEWTLDVLEALFDFYFVRPAVLQRKRDALNQKLQEAGKPAMK